MKNALEQYEEDYGISVYNWQEALEKSKDALSSQAVEIKKLKKIIDHDQREMVEGLANCTVENAVYVLRKYSKTYLLDEVADNHANLIAQEISQRDKRIAELEELLSEAKTVFDLSDYEGHRAYSIEDEPFDTLIRGICEDNGYGRVMDSAARQWFLKDAIGSHTAGACAGTIKTLMQKINKALKGGA